MEIEDENKQVIAKIDNAKEPCSKSYYQLRNLLDRYHITYYHDHYSSPYPHLTWTTKDKKEKNDSDFCGFHWHLNLATRPVIKHADLIGGTLVLDWCLKNMLSLGFGEPNAEVSEYFISLINLDEYQEKKK